MSEFRAPCPADDCDRTIPCRPPAPTCPHPWTETTKARIAARLDEIRAARTTHPAEQPERDA